MISLEDVKKEIEGLKGKPRTIPVKTSGALANVVDPGCRFRLVRIELHLSAAPTTSEDFTVTLESEAGPEYNTPLYSEDLSVESTVDLVLKFGEGYEYEPGDRIDVAYDNTDAATIGNKVIIEEI